ncbi:hypothetical protein D3C73_1555840 [compost metagenome]
MLLAKDDGIVDCRIRIAFFWIELAQKETDTEGVEQRTVQIFLGKQPFSQCFMNNLDRLCRFFCHAVDPVFDRFSHRLGE